MPPDDPSLQASLVQLSRANMTQRFNPQNPNDSRVKYYSVAGRSAARVASSECSGSVWGNSLRIDLLDPLMAVTEPVFAVTGAIPLIADPNDGLVTVESARWAELPRADLEARLDRLLRLYQAVTLDDRRRAAMAAALAAIRPAEMPAGVDDGARAIAEIKVELDGLRWFAARWHI